MPVFDRSKLNVEVSAEQKVGFSLKITTLEYTNVAFTRLISMSLIKYIFG